MEVIIAWLIRHPATIAFFLLFAVASGSSMWAKHETSRANELSLALNQATATNARILQDQQITAGISDDYQKQISNLDQRLIAARLRDDVCVVPTGPGAGRPDGSARAGKPVGQNGVSARFLTDFAAEAEKYRLQLIGLQKYVREVCNKK